MTLADGDNDVDLVIVDVSAADEICQVTLDELRRWQMIHGPRPGILCVSTVYRGPNFELEIERKGGRLVYV